MVSDGASNVWGSAYAETLTGNSGANLLQGNGGNDTLDGGEGSDTAVYNLAYDQYTLSEANGVVTVSTAGSDGTDNLTGIEWLTFQDGLLDISTWTGGVLPGFQADILVGTSGDDAINGSIRDNTISGLAGDDVIEGGAGADHIDGGAGIDYASYAGSEIGRGVCRERGCRSG